MSALSIGDRLAQVSATLLNLNTDLSILEKPELSEVPATRSLDQITKTITALSKEAASIRKAIDKVSPSSKKGAYIQKLDALSQHIHLIRLRLIPSAPPSSSSSAAFLKGKTVIQISAPAEPEAITIIRKALGKFEKGDTKAGIALMGKANKLDVEIVRQIVGKTADLAKKDKKYEADKKIDKFGRKAFFNDYRDPKHHSKGKLDVSNAIRIAAIKSVLPALPAPSSVHSVPPVVYGVPELDGKEPWLQDKPKAGPKQRTDREIRRNVRKWELRIAAALKEDESTPSSFQFLTNSENFLKIDREKKALLGAQYHDLDWGHKQLGPLPIGVCHFQGNRPEMEDEHLFKQITVTIAGKPYTAQIVAIFDGHGGAMAAKYLKENLADQLAQCLQQEHNSRGRDVNRYDVNRALKNAVFLISEDFKRENADKPSPGIPGQMIAEQGATAIITLNLDGNLYAANTGDARAFLVRRSDGEITALTKDAKPDDPDDQLSIEKRGGFVAPGRVDGTQVRAVARINGYMATGRAVGDMGVPVSSVPRVVDVPISAIEDDTVLFLTCDGPFEIDRYNHPSQVATTKDFARIAKDVLPLYLGMKTFPTTQEKLSLLARDLVYSCYITHDEDPQAKPDKAGSGDNLSVAVTLLKKTPSVSTFKDPFGARPGR